MPRDDAPLTAEQAMREIRRAGRQLACKRADARDDLDELDAYEAARVAVATVVRRWEKGKRNE